MSILSHTKYYLCGQVEHDNNCSEWRRDISRRLSSIGDGIVVWDPIVKPNWIPDDVQNDDIAFDNRLFSSTITGNQRDIDEDYAYRVWNANIEVRSLCRALASQCDILIARISKTFTWGSIDELEIAINRNIPIFLWLPDGPVSMYGLSACISNHLLINDYMHLSCDSLIRKLTSIDDGVDDLLHRDPMKWLKFTYPNTGTKNEV